MGFHGFDPTMDFQVLESTCAFAKTTIGTPYYLSPEICNSDDDRKGYGMIRASRNIVEVLGKLLALSLRHVKASPCFYIVQFVKE